MRLGTSSLVLVVVGFGADGQSTTPRPTLSSGPPLEPARLQAMEDYDSAQLQGDRAEMEKQVAPDYLIVLTGWAEQSPQSDPSRRGAGVKTDRSRLLRLDAVYAFLVTAEERTDCFCFRSAHSRKTLFTKPFFFSRFRSPTHHRRLFVSQSDSLKLELLSQCKLSKK